MTRLYFAHSAYEREQGKILIKRLESWGYEVCNPFEVNGRKEFLAQHGGGVRWENAKVVWEGEPNKEVSQWIVDSDLKEVRKSDILVAVFPKDLVTFGITSEHFEAARHLRMPTYTYVPEAIRGHPWIVAHSTEIFTDIEELMNFMENLIKCQL